MQNVVATWSALDLRRRLVSIGATVSMFAALLVLGRLAGLTDLALRWGFSHLGRFAQDYRRAFGEPPSRTLRPVRPGPAAPARGPSRRS